MLELRRPRARIARVGHRGVAPSLPTFDEALAHLAERFPQTVLQVDLKQRGVEETVVAALRRHGVLERSWISGFDAASLRRVAVLEPSIPRSYTLPRDRLGVSKRGPLAPLVRGALSSVGAALPRRVPPVLPRPPTGAGAPPHN